MKKRLLAAAVALALAGAAAAQTVDDATRGRNLEKALAIAQEAGEQAKARARLDEWLATLPKVEAARTELDLLEMAAETGHISRTSSRFAREHLNIVERYLSHSDPTRDPLHDFWSYRVMIDARHERGEIPAEEREYLVGRKHSELRRTLDAQAAERDQRAQAARQAAQRRAADQEAQARALEAERAQIMLDSFRSFRSYQPPPAVTCTRMGLQTICR